MPKVEKVLQDPGGAQGFSECFPEFPKVSQSAFLGHLGTEGALLKVPKMVKLLKFPEGAEGALLKVPNVVQLRKFPEGAEGALQTMLEEPWQEQL